MQFGIAAVIFLFIQTIQSSAYTALEMKQNCQTFSHASRVGDRVLIKDIPSALCWGAFTTMRQMSLTLGGDGKKLLFAPCKPVKVSTLQIILIFLKEANSFPEKLHAPVEFFVINSLVRAFPCKK